MTTRIMLSEYALLGYTESKEKNQIFGTGVLNLFQRLTSDKILTEQHHHVIVLTKSTAVY